MHMSNWHDEFIEKRNQYHRHGNILVAGVNFELRARLLRFSSINLVFVRAIERHHARARRTTDKSLHSFIDCRENRNFGGGRSAPNFN